MTEIEETIIDEHIETVVDENVLETYYNKRIEQAINDFTNEDYIKIDAINELFDNQIETAKKIILNFTNSSDTIDESENRNQHVVLYAQMQSGKTGVCAALINILKKTNLESYFGIKRYMFITGMNDKGLQRQSKERLIDQVFGMTESTVNDDLKYEHDYYSIYVYKNSELKYSKINLKNTLIFIDESHYGTDSAKNILNQFLKKSNIDWKNSEELKKNKTYIVSVSATPFNELISDVKDIKSKVFLSISEDYYGIKEYNDLGLLHKASNTEKEIESVIEDAYVRMVNNKEKGIVFIRTRKDIPINRTKWEVVHLDSTNEPISYTYIHSKIENLIYSPNAKPLLIFIKGAYRAGISIDMKHKDYVYAIYDYSSKREATLQGLLGRMCGYRTEIDKVDNTKFFINLDHCEDYISFVKGVKEYDKNNEKNPYTVKYLYEEQFETNNELELDEKGSIKNKKELIKWVESKSTKFKTEYYLEVFIKGLKNYTLTTINGSGFRLKKLTAATYVRKNYFNSNCVGKPILNIVYIDDVEKPYIKIKYGEIAKNTKTVTIGKIVDIKKTK